MKTIAAHLSIVTPVYQAEDLLDELIDRLLKQLSSLSEQFEIILVEDGSKDGSWAKVESNCRKDQRIKGIQLSRNFGQHAAIAAGIEAALGDWIVVMDCDLQDRPEEIPTLYHKAQEGYDIVLAKRVERMDTLCSQVFSKLFYCLLSFLSGVTYDSAIANFGIYHRRVIHPMIAVQSSLRYFPLMVNWVGFNQISIPIDHAPRPKGKSSYTFGKKCQLAINSMLAYSDKLLRLIVGFGLIISLMAFFFAAVITYRAYKGNVSVMGYASLMVSIAFFSGVIIFVLGILGLYIGKIFESTKVRPTFLIRKKING